MAITDLSALSALRTRMQWHQERQRVLAENIANADTPNFRPRDVVEPSIARGVAGGSLPLARTSASHVGGGAGAFQADQRSSYDTRPTGNSVNLEDEMLKVSANQMDYAAATSLYARSLGLLKTAIGKR
jgi:flagellar basal-body rod protein FlgB